MGPCHQHSHRCDSLAQLSNLRQLSFAAHILTTLPPRHADYPLFVDHEGAVLAALGFASQALTRYIWLVDAFTQRTQAETDRADYQRDLSISYNKLGDLYQGEAQDRGVAIGLGHSDAIVVLNG